MGSLKPIQLRLALACLAAIILALSLYVRQRFVDREQIALQEEMDGIFRVTQKVVKEELDKQNAELERFAQRMSASPDDAYWQTTADSIVNAQKGILALGYVDKTLSVRWIAPPKYADSLVKVHEGVRNNRPLVLSEAVEKGQMRMSEPVTVADMGRVFLAYYPVTRPEGARELMVAALHLQVLTDAVLKRVVPKDFAVALMDGYTEIYSRGARQTRSKAPEFSASLPVGTAKWGLKMWPSAEVLAAHKSDLPQWAIWGGVVLALLVMGLALMPMAARDEPALRPASTPAEWSRRWESALKDSPAPESAAAGPLSSGPLAGGSTSGGPLPAGLPAGAAGIRPVVPEPDREITLNATPRGALDENVPWVGAIAGVPDAVFVTETESMAGGGMPIVYVNEAFVRQFGYDRASILARNVQQLHGPKTEGKTLESLRTAQTKRLPLKSQITLHRQDGLPLTGTLSMRPVTDSMGRPTHWIFMHHADAPVAEAVTVPVAAPVPLAPVPIAAPAAGVTQASPVGDGAVVVGNGAPEVAAEARKDSGLLRDMPDLARILAAKLGPPGTEALATPLEEVREVGAPGLPPDAEAPVAEIAMAALAEVPESAVPAAASQFDGPSDGRSVEQADGLSVGQADGLSDEPTIGPSAAPVETPSTAIEPMSAGRPLLSAWDPGPLAAAAAGMEPALEQTAPVAEPVEFRPEQAAMATKAAQPPALQPPAPQPDQDMVGVSGIDALEMLIESSPLAMMGCDLAGKVTLWNGAAERMLGWREDEVLGRPAELLPPGFLPTPAALRAAGRNRVFETDVTRERKDGSRIDLSAWAAPLRDSSGSAAGGEGEVFSWIIFLADISDRKAAERSLERRESYYRSLLDAAEEMIAVVETDTTIRYLNPAVQRVLGYAQQELLGAHALDLVKTADQARAREALRAASTLAPGTRPAPSVFELRHKDGSWRTVESVATKMAGAGTLILNARDVTARQQSKEETGVREQMIEQVSDAIVALDTNCRVVNANPSARRLFDWRDRDIQGLSLEQVFGGWTVEPTTGTLTAALISRGAWAGELRLTRPDGGPLVLEVTISAVYNAKGERTGYFAIHRDVTERRRSEEALRASEERYALAARSANDGLWDWNLVTDEIYYSPRWKAMLGYDEAGIVSMPDEWFMLVHPSDIQNLKALIAKHLKGRTAVLEAEYRIRRKDGQFVWMHTRAQAVRDEKGRATRMVGSQADISEQKAVEDQLLHEAFHDALTALPNRVLFVDRLGVLLDRARHGKSPKPFAVLFLDVDRFKYVNDSLGHLAGDELLIEIGRRLQGCLSQPDTVARHGGDEFTVLLDNVPGAWAVQAACEKIQKAIATPMIWQGQEIYSTVSIGSTISTLGYERPDEMVRDADTALYQAKTRGRGRHVAFDKTMHAEARQHLQLEADLRRALERREFHVVFQPLIALGMGPNQGRLAGFEALLRWHHPKRGVITPEAFMAAAEETGLILDIDRWVMREACAQMKRWSTEFPNAGPLHVNVNLSGQHFQQLDLAEQIRNVLRATSLNPEFLRIELTESVLVKNQRAAEIFRELKEIKVQLNLDDFGTGYSSLSHLSKYPIDRLKIDRAFIKTMSGSSQAAEIIRGILLIARNLRINVIAEGVESAEQLEKLRAFGCEFAQGYHISQPLDPETASRLIASNPRW